MDLKYMTRGYLPIRTQIFDKLESGDIYNFCIAIGFILDNYEKMKYMNPFNKILANFNSLPNLHHLSNNGMSLIGDDIKYIIHNRDYPISSVLYLHTSEIYDEYSEDDGIFHFLTNTYDSTEIYEIDKHKKQPKRIGGGISHNFCYDSRLFIDSIISVSSDIQNAINLWKNNIRKEAKYGCTTNHFLLDEHKIKFNKLSFTLKCFCYETMGELYSHLIIENINPRIPMTEELIGALVAVTVVED